MVSSSILPSSTAFRSPPAPLSFSHSASLSLPFPSKTLTPTLPLKPLPFSPFKVLCSRNSSGKKQYKKRIPAAATPKSDPIYHNRLANLFVNRILKDGKKSFAFYIIYKALKRIQEKTSSNPLLVLREAMQQVTPVVTLKSRRVGGSTHQVPVELGSVQARALAIRWLLNAARERHGQDMVFKLSNELTDAAKGSGNAVKKKEMVHNMAEANRAFAHFR